MTNPEKRLVNRLDKAMRDFERNFLRPAAGATTEEGLIQAIAHTHAELLYLHPFREGNGRTARILANLMAAQRGYRPLNFHEFQFGQPGFDRYVKAVQQAAGCQYSLMETIIASTWTGRE